MKMTDMVGKTISKVDVMKAPEYDAEGWLRLTFTDGTKAVIVASFDLMYTGKSFGEYPCFIGVTDDDSDLVTV